MSEAILATVRNDVLPGMNLDLISQGAEALVFESSEHPYLPDGPPCVVKYRPRKAYRHAVLDAAITRGRTAGEAKFIARLQDVDGINVPAVVAVDAASGVLWLQKIHGESVKAWLWRKGDVFDEEMRSVLTRVGEAIAAMHCAGIVHGDLTTSNVLVNQDQDEDFVVTVIDFGLAQYSELAEDRAVDVHVLERAVASTHAPLAGPASEAVLAGYGNRMGRSAWLGVEARLRAVRARGRKRSLLG